METPQTRRADIDWLRIIAVFLLFPFHTAMLFFSKEDFYIKLAPSHSAFDYFVLFLSPWHMPFLFFLAGISTHYSLIKRSIPEYIIERTQRLLVPFLFGIVIIVPPQSYLAYMFRNEDKNFSEFFHYYWTNLFSDLTGYNGTFTPAHLWFVLYLYVYSIFSAKIFSYIAKAEQKISPSPTLPTITPYIIIFLYPILICILDQLPTISTKNPFYYYAYFLIGFIIPSIPKFESIVRKNLTILLCVGLLTATLYLRLINHTFQKYSFEDILFYILRRYNGWVWLLIVFSTSQYLEKFINSILIYLSEASYPIYILHQTVIIAVGYTLYKYTALPSITFFFICLIASILITLFIYHKFIREFRIFRYLFGMKSRTLTEVKNT
ncbi:MAG: acyltransferase [Candidatus Hydrogenedentes bacterium]|nr:acyltransferase [Candidatus Hydrogenedentota bacterium]